MRYHNCTPVPSEIRPTHSGDNLDPENELENEAAVLEEMIDDLEYAARYPTQEAASEVDPSTLPQSMRGSGYKKYP